MKSSFTDLLNGSIGMDSNGWAFSGMTTTTTAGSTEVPRFRSTPPPSLPLSPPPVSPSSYFAIPPGLSPTDFLDSPLLFPSSNVESPTVGAFAGEASSWRSGGIYGGGAFKGEQKDFLDFSFQPHQSRPAAATSSSSMSQSSSALVSVEVSSKTQDSWNQYRPLMQMDASLEKRGRETSEFAQNQKSAIPRSQTSTQSLTAPSETFQANANTNPQPSYFIREQNKSDDGYNWRKYGQKQVKGSENPRSYYKCTYPSCPTKKKVERSLDGHVTEIVYKGTHNHAKPLSTRRSSSQSMHPPSSSTAYLENPDQLAMVPGSENGQQDSSASMGDEDFEENSQMSNSAGDDDGSEPEAKRLRGENEYESYAASGNRTVREPRVVVQTMSEIDILDDGYRWRKYGQKVVKGNHNPRSYYKCTFAGCPVRKHVERASHDMRAVITTYEGKHNHDVPAARGSSSQYVNRPLPSSSNNSSSIVPMPIRPSTVAGHSNNSTYLSSIENTRLQRSGNQAPFTLQMLQSSDSYGAPGSGKHGGPYTSQNPFWDDLFTRTKEEPRENSDFDSFLS
ncbi:hypothetical protein BT93_K0371 [Corymbia citriodora subsp. variegata]|nr:hypothetical protein BT93_K0371 [Corymbia citriodora subsp. variegata]